MKVARLLKETNASKRPIVYLKRQGHERFMEIRSASRLHVSSPSLQSSQEIISAMASSSFFTFILIVAVGLLHVISAAKHEEENDAFWKRSRGEDLDAFWKRARMGDEDADRFWKRSGRDSDDADAFWKRSAKAKN